MFAGFSAMREIGLRKKFFESANKNRHGRAYLYGDLANGVLSPNSKKQNRGAKKRLEKNGSFALYDAVSLHTSLYVFMENYH